jgi:deoxyribodipyrimidine photo-lyase
VAPTGIHGGSEAARKLLDKFIGVKVASYAEDRNKPELDGSSGLSPYLHFGHTSPHDVFRGLTDAVGWTPEQLGRPNGKMNGFWNMSPDAEAFMDQLMSWREIGFNMCHREPRYDRYESLPAWALQTLDDHRSDVRPYTYDLEQFERAATHDELWNAAQRQLVREGRMHNYLRMLWGKKILHWARSPEESLAIMIHLNNKYALDGRDPNSYSGIFWVLGRYDRAWGPERPIFGKVRYMTSESTRSKFSVKSYIQRYGPMDS